MKGNRTIADLRYGEKDIISLSTKLFAPIKSSLIIYTLHIPPEVLYKVALILSSNECDRACFIHLIRMNEDDLSSCTKYALTHSFELHLRANF